MLSAFIAALSAFTSQEIQEFLVDWLDLQWGVATIERSIHEFGLAGQPLVEQLIEDVRAAEIVPLVARPGVSVSFIPDGMSIPDELAQREARLGKIAEARAKIEARGQDCGDGEGRGDGQEAEGQAAGAADRTAAAERSDQSDGRRFARHAGSR